VVYKGKRYRGEHQAIVRGRQWGTVQEILRRRVPNSRVKRNKQEALLQGILYCGACTGPMRHTYTTRKQQRYRYYACLHGEHCCGNRVPAVAMEASVLQQLESAPPRTSASRLAKACAAQTVAPSELVERLRRLIERVTYERSTGQVSIRLRTREERRHGAA